METIKEANSIIKRGLALLPDDAKADFKAQASDIFINEAIGNALGAVNENEEKTALLKAYAVQEANRMASTLWRLNILPDNLEAAFRALPPMTEVAAEYNKFADARKERMDKIMADHKVISDEERELDIFKGIINGISAKEAEKKYEDYKRVQQQAMAGGR